MKQDMMRYNNTDSHAVGTTLRRVVMTVACTLTTLFTVPSVAQVVIGGNVYGGGNEGNVGKSASVELKGGTVKGDVYGGARKANVGGYTVVNINGAGAGCSIIARSVYGGNDISGTIGTSTELPFAPHNNTITTDWNSFVRVATNGQHPVIIGSLYGGGNGAYGDDVYTNGKTRPVLGNTYVELCGGIYGQVYAGGNNATVEGKTVLYMDNDAALSVPSATADADVLSWFDREDYSTEGDGNIEFNHHVSRMFGGNNLAEMAIRPTWNLIKGSINNLYSGGNKGAMTYKNGILLPLTSDGISVNNVYGGCRMADVNPGDNALIAEEIYQEYNFPAGYATRVYVTAGNINNVYGGNDISGKVKYGTNVAIFSDIKGDVYGGGNGSYAYTDTETTSDYYYAPDTNTNSAEALFNFRPHIEKTLIHIAGNDAENPLSIGSVYCGGNSATLYKASDNAAATLKIGSNVTIGNVFLGSNGENMVTEDMLSQYANNEYNTITLTDEDQFKRYMDGVAVGIVPTIQWDGELNNTTIGSFFCGGNVGSMTYAGVAKTGNNDTFEFPAGLVITDKIVAGCNNANIAEGNYNAAYVGGLTGDAGDANNKVNITVNSTLKPIADNDGNYTKANIYGGCYNSGKVNGNVIINVNSGIIASDVTQELQDNWGDNINASYLSIYGGGYGVGTTIDGNTAINLTGSARVLKVFGGGEMGTVTGNTEVKLAQGLTTKDANGNIFYNANKVYAGGFKGRVGGNTTLKLLGGSVKSAFAGACNANIGGATEVVIGAGTPGVPYVAEAVYGGNDFGGTIEGSKLNTVGVNGTNISKNVRSQTYVKYLSGKIGRAIYGGSYGSYDYSKTDLYPTSSYTSPTILTCITKQDGDPEETILTNTFVNIASTSTSADDIIGSDKTNENDVLTMIAGGGRGYKGLPQYVEVGQTYLLLHGKDYANRNAKLMAHRVYGGGNLSKVNNTRIDAYSGSFGQIFGGTHGVRTEAPGDLAASYDCGGTVINYYGSMGKADMNLYGSGANSGATGTATINLHAGNVGNVYGGALAEGYTAETSINIPNTSTIKANAIFGGALGESEERPCDVGVSDVVFASATATVEDGIYGGNHTARATKETNITISTPVKNQYENLLSIYGAGWGAATVAGFTHVTLNAGAEVANVYGGGREGKVYNAYDSHGISNGLGKYNDYKGKYAHWAHDNGKSNTLIEINGSSTGGIAQVTGNVYGAGLGIENPTTKANANTRGKTKVHLNGGTVHGDIYGGGFAGTMLSETTEKEDDEEFRYDANIASCCVIDGGQVRNVFGGGYKGNIEGNSGVNIGSVSGESFYSGVPTILRSAYGGGEMAKVSGTSTVNMYNGYIGYRYDAGNGYQPELKLNNDDEANLLKENGNLYGAGYGEGAVVMNTQVNLHGGTIRNGLYGGGEIAAVGDGKRNDNGTYTVNRGGQTNVYMYGGLVEGDVFGGGRGFSYDFTGNQVIGTQFYTDGYVFGKTNVEIYRGTIGTDASVADGHGNVFGGGNIGYVYSAGIKYTGNTDGNKIKGHYYTNNSTKRTEDCRVHITAYSQALAEVEIGDKTFEVGEYVPTSYLNQLAVNDGRWDKLDKTGLTIRNAVFAGGNVSTGSDLVYANAVTVFGNATAAVVDVFNRDLISLGGENVGGLYGDGNLTFVDGYRELNITNYGTDFYRLDGQLTSDEYTAKYINDNKPLTPELEREKAYYTYDATNSKWVINSTSGRTMNTIQRADFCGVFGSRFLLHGARDRVPDVVDYTNYTINRVGEVSLNKVTQTIGDNEVHHGNYFGIYNVVNQLGALTSDVDFNSSRQADKYKYVETTEEYLTESTNQETYKPYDTYHDFKFNNRDKGFCNNAKSHNMVALASGVYLELIKSQTETNGVVTKEYGPVTGVIELDLLNVQPGEGGGYVYAKNEHRTQSSIDDKSHLTLSDANSGAITQAAYSYGSTNEPEPMQTSGNFVHSEQRVVDACFNDNVHFWYIAGKVYIYDQKISAFTGAARLYEQSINIPFTAGLVKIKDVGTSKYYTSTDPLTLGNKTYHKGDLITYWDWYQITHNQSTSDDNYANDFVDPIYVNDNGDVSSSSTDGYRTANEMSHNKGYLLTYEMSNPNVWDDKTPTVKCTTSGVYGQREYAVDDLVGKAVIDEHNKMTTDVTNANGTVPSGQAVFTEVSIDNSQAYICVNTLQKSETEYIFVGELISATEYQNLVGTQKNHFSLAYICTTAGKFGGEYFTKDTNYDALKYCALNSEDRAKFTYNYNALDLLNFSIPNSDATIADSDPYKTYYDAQTLTSSTSIQTSTLYVPRESDILNLSKDRVVSVVLTYIPDKNNDNEYSEDEKKDAETHVINIHVQFKSGQPIIGDVTPPAPVMPNTIVGLSVPQVTPGAYDIIGGGWEIFKTEADANSHKNGEPYLNNATPMYWYQDGYYLAYYAKTYLGKSYSNPVKFSVANYHRLSEVMNHKVDGKNEYMYIDHEDAHRNRVPKIYIDAAGSENVNKNDLDYLFELYEATIKLNSETVTNPETQATTTITTRELDERVKGCDNLEFILRSDIAPKEKKDSWSSVGTDTVSFAGNLHGNGYTISGLNGSLFGNLGGNVYNLGVIGSNIANGISATGRIENVWVSTTGDSPISAAVNYHFLTDDNVSDFEKGKVTHALNSYYGKEYNADGYVEKYFADGDFIYANGTIPLTSDIRLQNGAYKPLDDDYIFFGQRLIYDIGHESLPGRIIKNGNTIDRTANGNRVYSAPAYFMNSTPSAVYFNTEAKFVDSYDGKLIHHNLTAIDFTGYGETKALLDFEKLTNFALGDGLTKNLLVYANKEDDENSLYANLGVYLGEKEFEISNDGYSTIAKNEQLSRGHLVTKNDTSYVANNDHFLVDKENFNVPISYKFADDYCMWYQRTPDRFADGSGKGWDVICLPFTADLVTTHQKGEITHFYGDSTKMHEYWLRELKDVSTDAEGGTKITKAGFERPAASANDDKNRYTATSKYLYDTYYNSNDKNGDKYQGYYKDKRVYNGYTKLTANTPYIIAFPGASYYEFDMSGEFVPQNTHSGISNLDKQVVTMVSEPGATIGVTDTSASARAKTIGGYTFKGVFQKESLDGGYLIDNAGDSFDAVSSGALTVPFRGYLVKEPSGSGVAPERVFISGTSEKVEDPMEDAVESGLTIYGMRGSICIESTLEFETTVDIYQPNGRVVSSVTVMPMSKEVVQVPGQGIYVVKNRKIMVR